MTLPSNPHIISHPKIHTCKEQVVQDTHTCKAQVVRWGFVRQMKLRILHWKKKGSKQPSGFSQTRCGKGGVFENFDEKCPGVASLDSRLQ
jgi:hypothetical protein